MQQELQALAAAHHRTHDRTRNRNRKRTHHRTHTPAHKRLRTSQMYTPRSVDPLTMWLPSGLQAALT